MALTHELFRAAVKREGGAAAVAARLGYTRASVYHWISGNRLPSRDAALAIERVLRIPVRAWGA